MAFGPMPMPQGVPGGGLPPQPGGMPPGMQAPPGNLGPVTIPQSNPGNVMQALEKLHLANKLINEALPQIPLGSELHTAMLKMATELTKHLGKAKEGALNEAQTLRDLMANARNSPNMQALGRMPQTPNQPPAMVPPTAGAPTGMAA